MMPGVNFAMHGCSSARTTRGVSLYWSLTLEENIIAVVYSRQDDIRQFEKAN